MENEKIRDSENEKFAVIMWQVCCHVNCCSHSLIAALFRNVRPPQC